MKRSILHLLFWVVYLAYDTLLHFTWMGPSLSEVSVGEQLLMGIQSALTLLPIKLLLVYYIIQRGAKQVFRDDRRLIFSLAELGVIFFISVFLFRLTNHFIIEPAIYNDPGPRVLINARSIFIAILEMGLIGGAAFTLKLYRLQSAAKEREKNLTKEKLETELKFLRNQTNPHFLFNTLNNIYALARKKSDKTPGVVLKLSELLSFMLYESRKGTVTINEEIKMMEDYIELQRIRFNERLTIKFGKDIDSGNDRIAPLLLLPLIENAFKHGVGESRFDSFIHIFTSLQNGVFSFSIENNFENGKLSSGNEGNIGLGNLKRQLELMYEDQTLIIEKQDHTFKVNITINLNSYGKIYMYNS